MKSFKKYIAFLLVLSLIIVSLAACGGQGGHAEAEAAEPVNVRIGSLTGPTTLGLLKLYQDADADKDSVYTYQIAGTADEITPLLIKGELDVIAGPVNLAAVLNAKTEGKVQMLGITTLGVLYMLTQDDNIKTWDDMKGKTIYATGKGSTPEAVLTYLLAQNGLEPGKDVTVEFKTEPAEILALLKNNQGDAPVVMLPQPFATAAQAQAEGLKVIMDLTEEWAKTGEGSKLLTACLMVRKEFAEQNPEAVAQLLKDYEASAEWVNANVDEAAKLAEQYIGIKEGVAKKAIPLCNIVCITGEEMKTASAQYLKVLFEQDPSFTGGVIPGDDFCYIDAK